MISNPEKEQEEEEEEEEDNEDYSQETKNQDGILDESQLQSHMTGSLLPLTHIVQPWWFLP